MFDLIVKRISDWYTSKKVTEITTIIGNTGYGKTYLAGLIEEIYLKNEWPFGIIDKMGIHYVLRSHFDNVVIIGGPYYDFDLYEIDKYLPLIMEKGYSWILDLSLEDDSETLEYVNDLFEYLFEWHKKTRQPRNYILEECDFYMGQTGTPKQIKNTIIKCITKGRMNGFGFTLISQRFRMIDKTPLGQTRNYIVFNMKMPIDLSNLKKLVGDDVSSKVRRLKTGQCLVMTDEGYGVYLVDEKESANVAMTPEIGVELVEPDILHLNEEVRVDLGLPDERKRFK